MPIILSARAIDRYSNQRVAGLNGFAESTGSIKVFEESGVLLNAESAIGEGTSKLTGANITEAAGFPVWERASCSGTYGERVNYSGAIAGTTITDVSYTGVKSDNLGAAKVHCDDDEFSWNFSATVQFADCSPKKGKVTGVSGSITNYGSSADDTMHYAPAAISGVCANAISEEGSENDMDNGIRQFKTYEILSHDDVPWDEWKVIPQ